MSENKLFRVSYQDYLPPIFNMADGIRSDPRGKPNHVIGVSRGGLFAAVIICEIFKRAFAVVAAKTYHFDRSQKGMADIHFEGNIATNGPFGKFGILIDDLDETGLTLKHLREWMLRQYGYIFTNLDCAVVFRKGSDAPILHSGMAAPTMSDEEGNPYKWIIQPWEEISRNQHIVGDDPFSEMHRQTLRLICQIEDAGYWPDQIIAMSRDGILPGMILSEYFKVKKEIYQNGVRSEVTDECPLAVVTMQTYGMDTARLRDKPKANYFPTREICKNRKGWGRNWLLVDGFVRTGRTLDSTLGWLRSEYGAYQDRIRTAAVYRCGPTPIAENFDVDFSAKNIEPNIDGYYPFLVKPHVWAAKQYWSSRNLLTA